MVESESVNSFKNNYDKYVSKDRRLLGLSSKKRPYKYHGF
jgi:hypothetical protein